MNKLAFGYSSNNHIIDFNVNNSNSDYP